MEGNLGLGGLGSLTYALWVLVVIIAESLFWIRLQRLILAIIGAAISLCNWWHMAPSLASLSAVSLPRTFTSVIPRGNVLSGFTSEWLGIQIMVASRDLYLIRENKIAKRSALEAEQAKSGPLL